MNKGEIRTKLSIAESIGKTSTCLKSQQGCIVWLKDIALYGCAENPPHVTPCKERGYCERDKAGLQNGERIEVCLAVHAPQKLLARAAGIGISLKNTVLFATHEPCLLCLRMLINAGVRKIIYRHPTPHAPEAEGLYQDYCKAIKLEQFKEEG